MATHSIRLRSRPVDDVRRGHPIDKSWGVQRIFFQFIDAPVSVHIDDISGESELAENSRDHCPRYSL